MGRPLGRVRCRAAWNGASGGRPGSSVIRPATTARTGSRAPAGEKSRIVSCRPASRPGAVAAYRLEQWPGSRSVIRPVTTARTRSRAPAGEKSQLAPSRRVGQSRGRRRRVGQSRGRHCRAGQRRGRKPSRHVGRNGGRDRVPSPHRRPQRRPQHKHRLDRSRPGRSRRGCGGWAAEAARAPGRGACRGRPGRGCATARGPGREGRPRPDRWLTGATAAPTTDRSHPRIGYPGASSGAAAVMRCSANVCSISVRSSSARR